MAARPHLVLRADDVLPFQVPEAPHYLSQEILSSANSGVHDSFLNRGTLRAHHALGGSAHPRHDEIYYVLTGRGTLRLGGDPHSGAGAATYQVQEGTVVYIPANTFHAIANDSDHDLIFLTIWPQATGPGDNGIHDARVAAWGTAFRLQDGRELNHSEQGAYVTEAPRGWNPLFAGQ
jgi:mannose-6-phosphate isomerase-like protein (cupin superfamily)